MKDIPAREAVHLLRTMTWVLCAVGVLTLVFTTVNVTRFATSRGIPWPIALLLDPMIGTALAGVLYADARLASWGIRPPGWSTTLRWSAGCTAALMNTWQSLWPNEQIGWPRNADPAAVLLHLTPALLLIALTETIAAYRRTLNTLTNPIGPPNCAQHLSRSRTAPVRSDHQHPDLDLPDTDQPSGLLLYSRSSSEPTAHSSVLSTLDTESPDTSADPLPAQAEATEPDFWPHALALDEAARAATGKPVSIWRLRTSLHIGPRRARQLHESLEARNPCPAPEADKAPSRSTDPNRSARS